MDIKTIVSPKIKKEIKELSILLLIIMIVRTFLYQPFSIPSGSMISTLLVGDFLIVNKFVYGFGNETIPFRLPLFKERVFHKDPVRGEIVVFNNPKHEGLDYIKRLVGMPGDRIQMKKGVLHINGTAVKLKRIEDYRYFNEQGRLVVAQQYIETLPGGCQHLIHKIVPFGTWEYDNTPEFTIPKDCFFMMGDNRDNSIDSREPKNVGFVHKDQIMGRAEMLFFSTSARWWEVQKWLFSMRFERFFTALK